MHEGKQLVSLTCRFKAWGKYMTEQSQRTRPAPAPAKARGDKPSRRAPRPGRRRAAVIDLGTNNCRLLIAEQTDRSGGQRRGGGFRIVDSFSRIVRLGEGLGQSGNLSPEAMERTIEAL